VLSRINKAAYGSPLALCHLSHVVWALLSPFPRVLLWCAASTGASWTDPLEAITRPILSELAVVNEDVLSALAFGQPQLGTCLRSDDGSAVVKAGIREHWCLCAMWSLVIGGSFP
jgi:hypothetical protein